MVHLFAVSHARVRAGAGLNAGEVDLRRKLVPARVRIEIAGRAPFDRAGLEFDAKTPANGDGPRVGHVALGAAGRQRPQDLADDLVDAGRRR